MNSKILIRVGTQGAALFSVLKGVRAARDEDDKLRYAEALVHALAVALAIAVMVREIRASRHEELTAGAAE